MRRGGWQPSYPTTDCMVQGAAAAVRAAAGTVMAQSAGWPRRAVSVSRHLRSGHRVNRMEAMSWLGAGGPFVIAPLRRASVSGPRPSRSLRAGWLTNSNAPKRFPPSTFPPDRAFIRQSHIRAKEERIMVISRGIAGVLAGILVAFTFAIAMGGL